MPVIKHNNRELIEIGYLRKLHGIKGEIELNLGEEQFSELLDKGWIFVRINGEFIPFFIKSFYEKNSLTLVLDLEDVYSYDQAKRLLKYPVFVEVSAEEKDEYLPQDEYFLQFIGYKGITVQGANLGTLKEVEKSATNPLLIFEGEKIISIPIYSDFIKEINEKEKTITLDLPNGYLEVF